MKRYTHSAIILLAALALAGCSKTEELQYNPDSALQIESVGGISPFALMQEPSGRAVITGETLPGEEATKGIGLYVTATDGTAYDGRTSGYSNVKYTFNNAKWSAASPIYLSNTTGKLYGYFPYNVDAANLTAIPVVSSLNGTDYLYATSQEVSFTDKSVNLQMNHALARLHLTIKKGDKYLSDCSLSKIVLKSKAIDTDGTMDITTGTVTATKGADETGTLTMTGTDAVSTAGIEKDILLVPANSVEGKKDLTLILTIDGVDAVVTFKEDNGLDIRSGIQCNATLTIEDTGIKVTGVGVGVWGEGGSQTVEVQGHTVTVKLDEGVEGIEKDVFVMAYADGSTVTIEAVSKSGKTITCQLDDDTMVKSAPDGNYSVFTLPDVSKEIVATIGVWGEGGHKEVTVGEHKVKVVYDNIEDIEKDIYAMAYVDGGNVIIKAYSVSDNLLKCTLTGTAKVSKSKSSNVYTFTISDISSDVTATVGYAILPAGALPGSFTVNAEGKQVHFSKGNLWADASGDNASTPVLHFEANQYAFNSSIESSHVSHFSWSDNVASAVGNSNSGSNLFCDEANKQSVDGSEKIYYALSTAEWQYLFNYGDYTNEIRKNKCIWATVNGVGGYVIAPDGFTGTLKETYENDSELATAGDLVFLPAAGWRLDSILYNVGESGYYWSSSVLPPWLDENVAFDVWLDIDKDAVTIKHLMFRSYCLSVRLITEAK